MNSAAAIRGTFADFRLIKGRKVAQLVVELPIEEADGALATLGGLPRPDREAWVALARLNVTSVKPTPTKLAMIAGMRCEDPIFQRFLIEELGVDAPQDGDTAAEFVRRYCRVDSRKQLNLDPDAMDRWRDLDGKFIAWKDCI